MPDEALILVFSSGGNKFVSKVCAKLKNLKPTFKLEVETSIPIRQSESMTNLRSYFEKGSGSKRATVVFIFDEELAGPSRFASSKEDQEELVRLFRWCRAQRDRNLSKFIVVLDKTTIGTLLRLSAFFDQKDIRLVSANFLKKKEEEEEEEEKEEDPVIDLIFREVLQNRDTSEEFF